jgi:hypothetical protein
MVGKINEASIPHRHMLYKMPDDLPDHLPIDGAALLGLL